MQLKTLSEHERQVGEAERRGREGARLTERPTHTEHHADPSHADEPEVTLRDDVATDCAFEADLLVDGRRESRVVRWEHEPEPLAVDLRPVVTPGARSWMDDDGAVRFRLPAGEPIVEPDAGCVILRRTRRTLTQGRLAQHVFFHYLHQSEVMAHAWEIFGVSPAGFHRLRAVGDTPAEIGALYGRSRASVANSIVRVCRISADVGVRNTETPTGQAARFLRRQQGSVAGYLDQALHAPRRRRLGLPPTERGKEA